MTPEQGNQQQSEHIPSSDVKPSTVNLYGIDVHVFIDRYEAEGLREILTRYPTLCYLLGHVEPAADTETGRQIRDSRPDGIERPIWFLKEGSGIFGLKNPEDAMRWKGIFNHVLGTARFVECITMKFKNLTPAQKQSFIDRGYDPGSFDKLDPQLLRDFMFTTHAARRIVDEHVWHGLSDKAHPQDQYGDVRDSGFLTERIIKGYNAPEEYIELIKVEQHADHLLDLEKGGKFTDLRFAILTYCDWIFNQKPVTLDERFILLEQSGRETKEVLEKLKLGGVQFEKDFQKITGVTWEDIVQTPLPQWEYDIREAYARSAGWSLEDVFPAFAQQWKDQCTTYAVV